MKVNSRLLPNGIHLLHAQVAHTRVVHCGWVMNTGSRDEQKDEMGLAHFIEHMVFKGTKKRKTFHVLNYLESVGGDLNAYTTREKTCIYATLSREYFDRAVDLLSDIAFHSTFPAKEIVKEKQVIAEEIDMYRDVPDEAIFEDFDRLVFPHHRLGDPILGTKESINQFDKPHISSFIDRNFSQGRVAFSVIGDISLKRAEKVAMKYFGDIPLTTGSLNRNPPQAYQPLIESVHVSTQQAHQIIGGRAYGLRKGRYLPLIVLNNYLGGPAMNTLLNFGIRERHGLSYNIHSFYSPYSDAGMWGVYFAGEGGNVRRINQLVHRFLKDLREKPLGTLRLSQIKKQMVGQLTISTENLLSKMIGVAKDQLDFGSHITLPEIVKAIEAITASDLMETANEIFDPSLLSTLTYLPSSPKNNN